MASKTIKGYVGWLLPQTERDVLLSLFPARFSRLIAHHCTWKFGVSADEPLPLSRWGCIVGESVDPDGVQALVLSMNGGETRPDGNPLHITWSLADHRKPVQSNKVIKEFGVRDVEPVMVQLVPKFFPMQG